MNKREIAQELRHLLLLLSSTISEESVIEIPNIFPVWKINKKYKKDEWLAYGINSVGDSQLYRVLKNHKSETGKEPGTSNSADLYKIIGIGESGYPVWAKPISNVDAYDKNDIVDRNNNLYISIKNNNKDDPLDNTSTWEIYKQDGESPDNIPPSTTDYPLWAQPENKDNAYNKGDIVNKDGVIYISIKNNNMSVPGEDNKSWKIYKV